MNEILAVVAPASEFAEAMSQGWLQETLRANPVATFASGAIAFATIVGGFLRMTDNFWRSRAIDGASDKLTKSYSDRLEALTKDFERVLLRVDNAERDRDVFYREKVELSARVAFLEESLITIRGGEERVRDENARVNKEAIELRARVRELDATVRSRDAAITELQGKVATLEAAAVGKHRRSTDKG